MKPTEKFRQWLEQSFMTMKPGSYFPNDQKLARQFGISKRTVYTIMHAFARQGRVQRIQGRGTCIPSHTPEHELPSSAVLSSRDTIVHAVKRDIFNGTLKTGDALPAGKQYCIQFGVESRTVGKAYTQLVDDNLVVKVGRRYWVGNFSRLMKTGLSRDIFWFNCTHQGWRDVLGDALYGAVYRKTEHVLTTKGFRILYRDFTAIDSLMERWRTTGDFPQGLLFAGMQRVDDHRDFRRVNDLFERYFGRRYIRPVPSVVIVSPSSYRNMNPLIWQVAGTRPTTIAREVAGFTVSKYYRRATFFFNEKLSGNRQFYDFVRLIPELRHLRDDFELRFVVASAGNTSMDAFQQRLQSHYPGLGYNYLHRCLDKYGPIPLNDLFDSMSLVSKCNDVFNQYRHSDAWFFSNDVDAVDALHWCESHAKNVPGDIAIMSFENNPDYFDYGITSCVLDTETIGYNCAHALLDDIPVERTSRGFVRMKALVLERVTM